MKKLFFFLFLIICSFKKDGQNYIYNFNVFLEYKGNNNSVSYMLNSKDSLYDLQISQVDKVLIGFINDKNKARGFSFQVENFNNSLHFRYLNSQELFLEKYKKYKNNFVFDKKLIIIDSVFSNVKITVFKNKHKKNIVRQIEILLKKEDFIITNDFINHFTHGTFVNNEIKFPENYIPKKIVVQYNNSSTENFTYDLIQFKKINTQLITK